MSTDDRPPLEPEYLPIEVAKAMRKSEKWVRTQIKDEGIEHTRHGKGGKITFTLEQFKKFQARGAVVPTAQPVTTGPAKS